MSDTWEYVGEGGLPDIRRRTLKRSGRVEIVTGGEAVIAFDPPIIMEHKPYVVLTPHITSDSTGLVAANVIAGSYTQDAEGMWTGCTITATRINRNLPNVSVAINLSGAAITNKNAATNELVDWMAF